MNHGKSNATANSVPELLSGIVSFLTDSANFGVGNQWQLMRPASVADISDEAILKSVGDGQDAGLGAYGSAVTENAQQDTTSLRVRRPDGTWRSGLNRNSANTAMKFERLCVWSTNTESIRTLTV